MGQLAGSSGIMDGKEVERIDIYVALKVNEMSTFEKDEEILVYLEVHVKKICNKFLISSRSFLNDSDIKF